MFPEKMTAIEIEGGSGSASALKPTQITTPQPGTGEVLIRTRAAGVNRPDIFQRQGLYPPPPGAPATLGLEVAGEIVSVGDGVTRWRVGDEVTALIGGGGYAEYALADARHTLPIPAGSGWAQASALPETAFTVFANVVEHGQLKPGETILIHGATSGVGVMAIQLAKALGARVIATGRGSGKAAEALKVGADISIDTTQQDFTAIAQDAGGADVVLDMVAGPYFQKNLETLRAGGRLVHIAFQAGARVELPIPLIMQKRLIITGSTLRGRDAAEKARLAGEVERVVWPLVEAGEIQVIIDREFPLEEAGLAHARLEEGGHVGKVVLSV